MYWIWIYVYGCNIRTGYWSPSWRQFTNENDSQDIIVPLGGVVPTCFTEVSFIKRNWAAWAFLVSY